MHDLQSHHLRKSSSRLYSCPAGTGCRPSLRPVGPDQTSRAHQDKVHNILVLGRVSSFQGLSKQPKRGGLCYQQGEKQVCFCESLHPGRWRTEETILFT